jgi:hypothetical protein
VALVRNEITFSVGTGVYINIYPVPKRREGADDYDE